MLRTQSMEGMNMMKLDRNAILKILSERQMTIADLAQSSDVAAKTLYSQLGGGVSRRAWYSTVLRLAHALQVDPASIVLDEDSGHNQPEGE